MNWHRFERCTKEGGVANGRAASSVGMSGFRENDDDDYADWVFN